MDSIGGKGNKMKKLLGNRERKVIALIIGLLLLLNLSLNLSGTGITPLGGGDDQAFSKYLLDGNLLSFLHSRYTGWSSRLVIEVILSLLTHATFLWRIGNAIAMFGVVYIPYYLIMRKENDMDNARNLIVSYALFFMLPFKMFYETGWMATTMNYLWVLFMAELAMLPSLMTLIGKKNKTPKSLSVIALLALIYAANQEQMVVMLVLANLSIITLFIYKHQSFRRELVQLVIACVSMLIIVLAPGNAVRKVKEVHWLPLFPTLSPFKKIELGFSSTLGHFFFNFDMLALVLLVLLVLIYVKQKKVTSCMVIGVPIILMVALTLKDSAIGKIYPGLQKISTSVTPYGTNIIFNDFQSWVPDLILLMISAIVILGILWSSKKQSRWIITVILVLGVLSRIMMGFSPTIWASGERTFLFLYEAIICACLYLYNQLEEKNTKKVTGILLSSIGFASYLLVLMIV